MATSVVILPPGFGGGSGGGGGEGADSYSFDAPIFEVRGNAAGPAYSFTDFQDRGMYSTASQLAFAVGGQAQLLLSATTPASFSRGISVGGPLALSAGASIFNGPLASPEGQTVAPVGSVYLSSNGGPSATVFYKATGNDQNGWRPVVDPSNNWPSFGPATGAGTPTYSFLDGQGQQTTHGLYATAAGEIGLARNGAAVLRALTDGSIRTTGSLTANGASVIGSLVADTFQSYGNALISGGLTATGAITANSNLSVAGTTSLAGPLSAAGGTFAQTITLLQRLTLPGGPQVIAGTGDPQGSVVAAMGSIYLRSDSGGPPSLYSKIAGSDANGWSALLTTAGLSYPLMAPSSAESAPTYSFTDSSGAGMGYTGGVLSFSTGSVARLQLLASGTVRLVGPVLAQSTLTVAGAFQASAGTFAGNLTAQQVLTVGGDAAVGGLLYFANGAAVIGGTLASPSNAVSARPGSLYLSSTGGPGSTLFIKEQGVGATGWTPFDPSQYGTPGGGGGGTVTYPLLAPYGSQTAPSYGFSGNSSGLTGAADGSVLICTAGTTRLRADASGTVFATGRLTVSSTVIAGADLNVSGVASFADALSITGALTGTSGAFSAGLQTNLGLTLGASTKVLAGNLASPEGNVSATAGSLYLSNSGGIGKTLFVKESDASGSASSSGWVAASGSTSAAVINYPLLAPASSAAAPSYAFAAPNGSNSGLFGLSDGSVGLSSGGTQLVQLSPNGSLALSGTVSVGSGSLSVTPAASFASGVSVTGAASFASGLSVGAAQVLSGTLTSPNGQVSAAQGSVYLSTAGGTNSTLWVRESGSSTTWTFIGGPGQISYPLRSSILGSATSTAFGFASDSGGSGLYAPASGSVALATGGVAALSIDSSQAASFSGSLSIAGTTSAQAITAAGALSVSGATTLQALTASGISSFQNVSANAVSASSLSVTGSAAFNAGMGVGAAQVLSGSLSSPDGQVSAPQGSVYLSTAGGINATLFVRESGNATQWTYFGAPGQVTFPLRSPLAGTASSTAIGFTANSGGSGIYAPSTGALGFSSGGSASLILGSDQSASFSSSVSVGGNLSVAAAGVLTIQGTSQFNGSSQFVASALFSQGVTFPGNETIFGGSQANPNGFVTASAGSVYLSSTGGSNKVLWVKETGASSSTGWVSYGNPSATAPAYPLLAPNGTVTAPSYTFAASTSTGLWSPATNALSLATNGVAALSLDASQNATFSGTVLTQQTGTASVNALAVGAATTGLSTNVSGATFLNLNVLSKTIAGFSSFTSSSATHYGMALAGSANVASSIASATLASATFAATPGSIYLSSNTTKGSAFLNEGTTATSTTWAQILTNSGGWAVSGPATFNGPVTFTGTTTGLTATPSYPLAAPTGTTASPNFAYSFAGQTNSGMGYDTTTSATTLYAGGTGVLRSTTTGIGIGLASPTASNVLLLASTTGFAGLSVNQPTIQLQSTAAAGSSYSTVDSAGAIINSLAHNVLTGDGIPVGTILQSFQTKPLMFAVGTAYTNIAAIAYNVSGSYFWTFGSKAQSLSTVGVAGSLAVGATVASATAAPTNGVLVQGNAYFQSNVGIGTTTPNTALAIGANSVTSVSPLAQINAPANLSGSWGVTDRTAGLACSFGYSNFGQSGYGVGTMLSVLNANPFYLVVNNSAACAINATSNTRVGIGSSTASASQLGVFGNLAVGATVASGTAAPTNGLLVQGNAQVQGQFTAASTTVPLAASNTTGGTQTLTTAMSGQVFILYAGGTATLPPANAAAAFTEYTIMSYTATVAVTTASASDIIYWAGPTGGTPTNKASGTTYTHNSPARGAQIKVMCTGTNIWVITQLIGTAWI